MMREFSLDRRTIMKRLSGILLIISVLILSAVIYRNVDAQEEAPPIPQDDVNAVAKELYCPVCENIPLDVCPTQACEEWRELIRLKLSDGWSAAQIKAYFVEQYGDRVLASPPASGFNWLVYIIPPLAIITGGFLLYKSYQSMLSNRSSDQAQAKSGDIQIDELSQDENDDEYLQRLEDELSQR